MSPPPPPSGLSAPTRTIDFMRGWPARSLLPVSHIQTAAQAALSDPSIAYPGLNYGPESGFEPLRQALATWLSGFYAPAAGPVTAPRLTITGGASQNLAAVLAAYTDPSYTRAAWCVAPAYFLAFGIFADAGLRMRGVPEDEAGLDLGVLEAGLTRCEEARRTRRRRRRESEEDDCPRFKSGHAKIYKHVIYCVPSFANPSGRMMTRRRREELVRLARRFDALVVCDDVYDFLQWRVDGGTEGLERARLPRLVDVDRSLDGGAEEREGADGYGNVASNGSFSKLIGPGMRVGWCEGTEKFAYGVSQIGATCSGGAPSQLTSTYVAELVTSGVLAKHISEALRPAYAQRYARLRAAVESQLVKPLGFALRAPTTPGEGNDDGAGDLAGGFFMWLAVPRDLRGGAAELARRCRLEQNVVIAPGELFEVPRSRRQPGSAEAEEEGSKEEEALTFEGNFRLCFSNEDEDILEEGVRRIAAVAVRMLKERRSSEGYVLVESSGQDTTVYR